MKQRPIKTSGPKMRIKTISSKNTLHIRQLVLRPGKNLDECIFEKDNEPGNFHLGAFEEGTLMGIVSLMGNENPAFKENHQFQLRGMAVLPQFQNRKIAKNLLKAAEEKLSLQKTEILWCNARETAVGFYAKHNFEPFGELFEIPTVGPHVVMFKKLK